MDRTEALKILKARKAGIQLLQSRDKNVKPLDKWQKEKRIKRKQFAEALDVAIEALEIKEAE